ncbi:ATP-binding protein [Vibrio chagasii]|nr:ATP-binding protein [Vibrio chagasii]
MKLLTAVLIIAEDKQKSVFDKFQQFRRQHHSRIYGGTGLELTICDKIVVLNGQQAGLTSIEGKGSTFYFVADFDPCLELMTLRVISISIRSRYLLVDDSQQHAYHLDTATVFWCILCVLL